MKKKTFQLGTLVCLPVILAVLLFYRVRWMAEKKVERAVVRELLPSNAPGLILKKLARSNLDVRITPLETSIRFTRLKNHTGQLQNILILPINIENRSKTVITSQISHEFNGGMWLPTDLAVYLPDGDRVEDLFLAGETEGFDQPLTLRPNESARLDVRMDWPGTPSVPAFQFISLTESKSYSLRVVLLMGKEGNKTYIISREMNIDVTV
jgi:hypothetical protein